MMNDNHMLLGEVLRKYGPEVFGTLGALIGLSFIEKLTVVVAAMAMLAGIAFAIVGAPIMVHYMDPPSQIRDHVVAGAAIVMGIGGFFIAGAISLSAQRLKEHLPDTLKKMLDRKIGG